MMGWAGRLGWAGGWAAVDARPPSLGCSRADQVLFSLDGAPLANYTTNELECAPPWRAAAIAGGVIAAFALLLTALVCVFVMRRRR